MGQYQGEQLSVPRVDTWEIGIQRLVGTDLTLRDLIGTLVLHHRNARRRCRGIRWCWPANRVIGRVVAAVALPGNMVAAEAGGQSAEEGYHCDLSAHDRNHPWLGNMKNPWPPPGRVPDVGPEPGGSAGG